MIVVRETISVTAGLHLERRLLIYLYILKSRYMYVHIVPGGKL